MFNSAGREIEEADSCLCHCSQTSMTIAVTKLGPSFVYDLFVYPKSLVWARGQLRDMMADVKDNPFAPYVNLRADPHLPNVGSWYMRTGYPDTGSRYVGSEAF